MTVSNLTVNQVDRSGERTSTIFKLNDALANLAGAGTIQYIDNIADSVKDAIDGVTLGLISTVGISQNLQTLAAPTQKSNNDLALRESKWLVRFHGVTSFKSGTMEIGCADSSLVDAQGQYMDLSLLPASDLVDAIQNYHTIDGNESVVVDSVELVGRNI